jgi:acyl carrier protein
MTSDEIRMTVLRALGEIAPEADLQRIKPEVSFRQQLDIDSMDFLNFVIALHTAVGIEIPERDYPQLATLQGCINYLTRSRATVRETVPGTSTLANQ